MSATPVSAAMKRIDASSANAMPTRA